jgi:hypothetical protein
MAGQAMSAMIRPDYAGGSIVNLMASIEAACGGNSPYPVLRALPPAELADARNVILLVIDGLGYEHLARSHADALRKGLRDRITSVFPSTTASAVTTFLTGLAPQQHGLTGWFTYFKELGSVAAVLPFQPRHGGASYRESGIDAATLFRHTPFFDKISVPSYVVSPQWIVHSDFNAAHAGRAQRIGYRTLEGMFQAIAEIVRSNAERKYIYAYYPELDAQAHQHGVSSPQVEQVLSSLDSAFVQFMAAIQGSGSSVVVTADHGIVDTVPERRIELDQHPALAESLVLPLCGEPRVAYCYVHPEKTAQFEDYGSSQLSEQAWLFNSRQLVEEGWFGPGPPHPRLIERVGHYALVMRGNYVIKDWLLGEHRYTHAGVHGGVSAAEMFVPLIVVRTQE